MSRKSKKQEEKAMNILNEIREVNHQLQYTDVWFQNESDSALIESCIYQREALNAKYKMLLEEAKENNVISPYFTNNNEFK